ncbi:hypothetical protein DFQ26_004043 [Actinomortierella ambigua]|nr:hypothetical protein DFQ26_004043 [Actinomortierella ambigua]
MLHGRWKESSEGVIRKPNIEADIFDLILRFIYTGNIELPTDKILDLVHAAAELTMTDLLHSSEPKIAKCLSHANVFDVLMLSTLHGLAKLQDACRSYIAKHASALVTAEGILALDADQLGKVLAMDEFKVPEVDIWKVALHWACIQQDYDYTGHPFLSFPNAPGRFLVSITNDSGDSESLGEKNGTTATQSLHADKIVWGRPEDRAMIMPAAQHMKLKSTIAPVLHAIRFHAMDIGDFHRLVESSLPVLEKLFQASKNGFSASAFHAACDNKGATLTVAKTSNGHVLGGMNTPKDGSFAALNSPHLGPVFGAGPDLRITINGKYSSAACSTYADLNLSSVVGSTFDVVDYEVFKIL